MFNYTPEDWYWIVEDNSRIWSSLDSRYVETVPSGKDFTRVANELELSEVLKVYGLNGPVPIVPYSISPLQARKVLRVAGVKAIVDSYVQSLPEEDQEEWDYATEVLRDNVVIAAGGAALGWTDKQIDDLFILGATL